MGYVYKPRHQRQIVSTDPYGRFNCTAYSAAMAIDRATLGGTSITGQQVRALSNEPIPSPSSPGLDLGQVCAVASRLYIQLFDHRGESWANVIAALKAYRGVILQGDYDQMGAYSCQSTFRDDHAIYVNHIDGTGLKAYVDDPLCAAGKYIDLVTLQRYANKLCVRVTGHDGAYFATTRMTQLIAKPSPGF